MCGCIQRLAFYLSGVKWSAYQLNMFAGASRLSRLSELQTNDICSNGGKFKCYSYIMAKGVAQVCSQNGLWKVFISSDTGVSAPQ